MNASGSDGESQSATRTGLRGTQHQGTAEDQAVRQGQHLSNLTDFMMQDPSNWMNFGRRMLPGGKFGMGENADAGVGEYGNMMFNNASANSAFKGQTSPENMSNVIGSAVTNSLPFLIPQMQQFQQMQFMAPQSLMGTARASADYWNRALGAQSDSSSYNDSFGFGVMQFGGGS